MLPSRFRDNLIKSLGKHRRNIMRRFFHISYLQLLFVSAILFTLSSTLCCSFPPARAITGKSTFSNPGTLSKVMPLSTEFLIVSILTCCICLTNSFLCRSGSSFIIPILPERKTAADLMCRQTPAGVNRPEKSIVSFCCKVQR